MEKHKCKLCSRKFINGKALGGHMRSHLMALPLPPKIPPPENQDSGESTLSENQEQVLGSSYVLRENPKKSFRRVDPEFLEYVVQDRESETESTKNNKGHSTGRRSKRSRKMENEKEKLTKSVDFVEPLSLFSDSSSEEDVAMCLMMLSRDVWIKQGKYQCGICYKMFKTTQALGSHKTIHKNKNNSNYEEESQKQKPSRKLVSMKNILDEKLQLHDCPFCGKRFKSGQALGGHKRSHLLVMSSSTNTGSCSSKLGGDSLMECSNSAKLHNGFIDLNMPAPMEDEDDYSQQPDFYAVSNADFQQNQEHERG